MRHPAQDLDQPLAAVARSLPDLFARRAALSPDRVAWHERGRKVTWREFHAQAGAVASWLIGLGLTAGERVTIVGKTAGPWCVCDLGGQLAGLVTVGAYQTLTDEQLGHVLGHSGSRVVFVEPGDDEQRAKIEAVRARLPHLVRVVSWDDAAMRATPVDAPAIAARTAALRREDTAILVYTSGTTGAPKGAMLSHDNILASLEGLAETFAVAPDDVMFSFLPLAHAAERICGLYARINVGLATAFASDLAAVLEEVKQVKPTYFGAVPRIFEKAHARIQSEVARASPARQRVFRWAEKVGVAVARRQLAGQPVPLRLRLAHRFADKLVFARIREVFGGRVKRYVTGAAPIPLPVLEFFWGAGFPVYEVYGMTEATCCTHANQPGKVRLGSVGKPVKHVEARLADDGEVLIRGRVVFQGYFADPAATAEAIDAQGWLHTGDIGKLDDQGFLHIVDRKKHIVITSGGKNLAPATIENAIKAADPLIAHVHVHADRRPYASALISLNPLDALEWAQPRMDVAAVLRVLAANPLARPPELPAILQRISAHPELRARLVESVRRGNRELSRVERVKRVLLLDRELSAADDELTPTLKVKRREVERRFAADFDRLYADPSCGLLIEGEA